MAKVTWSTTALAAFSDVFRALEERSPASAARLEDRVEALLGRLALFPESGRATKDLEATGLREAVIAPYVVLYLVAGDSVVLVAFTYGVASDQPDEIHEAAAPYGLISPS